MTPELKINEESDEETEEEIPEWEKGPLHQLFFKIKRWLTQSVTERSFTKPEAINGHEMKSLSTDEVESRYKKNVPIMKDHIIKWLEKEDLRGDTEEIVEWLQKSDLPEEKIKAFFKPFKEVDLDEETS